jgi:DNA-binding PadR family transcriptional regulator
MASDLTSAELTLLGLLAEKPRHGYELEEVIAARGMRDWTEIGFSSIYYLLGKLRDRGLIAEIDALRTGRGKARKVYAPTEDGQRECAKAAEAAVAELRPVFPAILVGLANQPVIAPERFNAALAQRGAAVAERIAAVRQAADDQDDAPGFVRAIFDYALNQLVAEQDWLAAYRTSLADSPTTGDDTKTMPTYDLKRDVKELYAPRNTDWALVDVPEQQFIAIDGSGNPNTSAEYARAVEALYAVAYTIKFASKRGAGRDFVVAPLEGLWWADEPDAFTAGAKDSWQWTMLINQPDWVTEDMIEEAKLAALAKKKLPAIDHIRHLALHEGRCAQALHIGPYDAEAPLLASLYGDYLGANHLQRSGLHHEIYLGDPRKTDPAKLKTILRQPVRPAP